MTTGNPLYDLDLTGCADACANTPGCIDVSLSGNACYLKESLMPAGPNSQVNGALIIGYYTVTSTKTTTTGNPTTATPTSSTLQPTPTEANPIQCPTASGTVFTGACGSQYVVECFMDRRDADSECLSL